MVKLLWWPLALVLFFAACRKPQEALVTANGLEFSSDTVYLDTVFSTIGSSTRVLKVYNRSDVDVVVPRIAFGRGAGSYFRMNVNGIGGKEVLSTEILAGDSIYIFIEVTADVMGAPELLYTDSLVFGLNNGKQQDVKLVTWLKTPIFIYLPRPIRWAILFCLIKPLPTIRFGTIRSPMWCMDIYMWHRGQN